MATETTQTDAERRAAKATAERERRARLKTERERVLAEAVAARAREIAPEIQTPIRASVARGLLVLVGREDPLAYAGLAEDVLDGRTPRETILSWARGELPPEDPAAVALRARTREMSRDERAKHLWGRKAGALLVALADVRAGVASPNSDES